MVLENHSFQENFLNLQVRPQSDPSEFLLWLRETFRPKPTPKLPVIHLPHVSVLHSLKTCSHVFVMVEGLNHHWQHPIKDQF
ncbi:hypothetical protein TNIN_421571 [Trichonephila inaurata madagascariensis]|uniref:Uncharacterized protein n=1 Tax=Trichonephila inaurata madagascariensis TaxID=2747483 RepID=A0A8X6Y831_9ARAC|nr:hypothetical protein TNIN_421571 [Trichonephila inaurata madagascariensis]